MRLTIIAFLPIALLAACGGDKGAKTPDAPLVKAEAVTSQRFVDRIDAVGTALANEQVILAAPVTERITKLNFRDGGYVGAGQVVAVLALGQEDASLAEAAARQREADLQLGRLEQLKARGFATKAAVDTQVALAGAARASASSARASIDDRVIRAPFGGWLSLRNISLGAIVTAGTEIATISDVSRIKLDFSVPETLLASLAPGQAIAAIAAAYPGKPFRGVIESIDPVVNAETRAVTVRAILPNPERLLKPGMLLTVTVESAARNAVSVPELAIVGEANQSYVFLIGEGGKVKRAPVKIGARQNGVVEILQGLSPGQRIVTEGVVKLADGMKVSLAGAQNAKPAAARN
ncbi:efflux RND transporter periplasmic adaptor subunit [Sphingobium boeckii]|uniref:Membrane fusion protein (Multidrug efflux system) n=1 Tax=Sphingobium boeckii TaxID=1082345 RepID=A0A7W9AIY8_9SPHN|nr:efflux RND transporter periplasmic adaptor subunit [Sphingobium boeckii]MBB5686549.1 membrane fusion protein (multidrug efflux system) [Sphingobium boeckii]